MFSPKALVVVALLLQTVLGGKISVGGGTVIGGTTSSCAAPTAYESNEWPLFGAITCPSGCTTGNAITLVPDTVGGNHLYGAGGGNNPTYQSSAFGSLGAASFSPSAPTYFDLGTPITTGTSFSMWATIQPILTGSDVAIFGPASAQGPEWRIDTTGHQELLEANVVSLATGTATLTSGSKYTVGVTVNTSTGAWTFYTFSGGSSSVDATGTTSMSFTNPIAEEGLSVGVNGFSGLILDSGYYAGTWNSTALTAIAAYSHCNAGV